MESFTRTSINPKDLDIKYSRSSGPGGQSVNKVNSKVTVKMPLKILPNPVANCIKTALPNRINKVNELIVQSDRHRTQLQNQQDCMDKLHEFIRESCVLPNETSDETKKRVDEHKKGEKLNFKKQKQFRSTTKQNRRKDF